MEDNDSMQMARLSTYVHLVDSSKFIRLKKMKKKLLVFFLGVKLTINSCHIDTKIVSS